MQIQLVQWCKKAWNKIRHLQCEQKTKQNKKKKQKKKKKKQTNKPVKLKTVTFINGLLQILNNYSHWPLYTFLI